MRWYSGSPCVCKQQQVNEYLIRKVSPLCARGLIAKCNYSLSVFQEKKKDPSLSADLGFGKLAFVQFRGTGVNLFQ